MGDLTNLKFQARLIQYLISELRETLREKRNTLKAMMQVPIQTADFLCLLSFVLETIVKINTVES